MTDHEPQISVRMWYRLWKKEKIWRSKRVGSVEGWVSGCLTENMTFEQRFEVDEEVIQGLCGETVFQAREEQSQVPEAAWV